LTRGARQRKTETKKNGKEKIEERKKSQRETFEKVSL